MLGDSLRRRNPPRRPAAEPTPAPRTRARAWPSWSQWLLIAAGVLVFSFGAGYLLATQVVFPAPETAGTAIPVPDLVGREDADARARVQEAGLVVGDVSRMSSMEAPPGRVLAQDPLGGQQLRPGAAVSITVSSGPPTLRVPPLIGLSAEAARELLESVGFGVEVEPIVSPLEAGVVTRTRPTPGSEEQLPAVVTLEVSTGPAPADSAGAGTETVGSAAGVAPIGTRVPDRRGGG